MLGRRVLHGVVTGAAAMLLSLPVLAADMPPVGAPAPTFTLPSQDGSPVSLNSYHGKWVVLYFYPKDQTSGCSLEAHNFQQDTAKYNAVNAVVLGVFFFNVSWNKEFFTKDSLTFKLLADPDHKVVDEYGVPLMSHAGTNYASRDTFLISPEGKIMKMWQVKNIQGHSSEVLSTIQSFKQ